MDATPVDHDPFGSGEITTLAPTTEPQREVIVAAAMSPEANTAYNEAVSLRILGNLDPQVVERALAAIVERHDALRSTFTPQLDSLVVTSQCGFTLERHDHSGESAAQQTAALSELWHAISSTPMALNEGPLFRAYWLDYGPGDAELVLLAHHAICDGWSFGVILRELSALCAAANAPLPPAPSFATFAETQHSRPISNRHADHWLKRFADKPPALDLPTDRPRPARRTFAASRVDHAFSPEATRAIAAAAGRMRASSVGVLLAGVTTLLRRLADVDDITIGMPVARQALENHGDLVGHCVQLLPIRLACADGIRFEELVAQAKSAVLDATEHYDFTFGSLVRGIGSSGELSRVPLIPVVVNVDQPLLDLRLGDAVATVRTVPRTAEAFEIFLNVMPNAASWVIEATFNSDLFDDGTIRAWLEALECLLVAAASDPTQRIDEVRLLAGPSAAYSALNRTQCPVAIDSWLEAWIAQAKRTPDATAVIDNRGSLTYGTLLRRARILAHELIRRGVKQGDIVGLFIGRSVDLSVALAGIHLAGAAHLPLDPEFPDNRRRFQIEDTGARIVVIDRSTASLQVPPGVALLDLETASNGAEPAGDLPRPDPRGLAYVIYTSGSTGRPKGVRLQHRALANLLASTLKRPGLTAADTLVAVTTIAFDISVVELLAPLMVGGRIVIATRDESADPQVLAAILRRHKATVTQATPATWRMLVDDGWPGMPDMRAFCTGERLPRDLAAALLPRVRTLWNLYGPTETCVWSSCAEVRDSATASLIGTPFDNTEILILGRNGELMPPAVPGEIFIGGLGLAEGYQNLPQLTAEKFIVHERFGRLYRTGDRGRLRASGTVECFGRMDDQIKLRGFRIELGEIETVLCEHPLVDEAAVGLATDDHGGVRIVAYVVCRGTAVSIQDMKDHLGKTLPSYMVPQQMVVLPALPRLPNGKLDRRSLPKPSPTAAAAPTAPPAQPETPLERTVLETMRKVLRVEQFGVEQDFFDAGGHSLLAAQLVARLNRECDTALTMRAVFESPTPRRLALAMTAGSGRSHASTRPIPHRPDSRISPVTHVQERIWFMERMLAGRPTYNLPSAHRLVGKFDPQAFGRAFQAVVDRQSVLRTTFERRDGQLLQVVHDHLAVDMGPIEDLSTLPPEERTTRLMERLEQLTAPPFELDRLPLFRVRLFRLAEQEHVFFFMPHHIVWDGWSFDLLYEDLAAYYRAQLTGEPARRPTLPITFGDFAAWHRELLGSTDAQQQAREWRERLARFGPVYRLPFDGDASVGMSGEGSTEWVTIDAGRTRALHEVARTNGATLFVTTLALYSVLLHGYARQSKLLLATPVRGRESVELEGVMGCCNNLLPLPLEVRPEDTFEELIARVKAVVLDSFARPDVLLEQIAVTQPAAGDATRATAAGTPVLYHALFSFQDVRRRISKWGELDHSMIHLFQKGATEDLGMWFVEREAGLVGGLTHNVSVLTPETVRRLRDEFARLIDAVLADPSVRISDLASRIESAKVREDRKTRKAIPAQPASRPENPTPAPAAEIASKGDRRDYEFILLQVWQRVLGHDRLTVHDDFFESGGNSLAAIQAVVEFEAATGITIDLGDFFRSPTVAALAEKIGAGVPPAPAILIPLQPNGSGTPLFCLFGIQFYRHFARCLGDRHPTYGFYVREEQDMVSGSPGGEEPTTTRIDALATAYVTIIRQVCPNGPLHLAGVSYGGVIAMEVARRLTAAGIRVDTVLLLDTILPGSFRHSRMRWIGSWFTRAWRLGVKGAAKRLLERLSGRSPTRNPPHDAATVAFHRFALAMEREIAQWMSSLPKPEWRVVLVRAKDNSEWGRGVHFLPDYGWGDLLDGRLEVVRVDGSHLGILAPPHVEATVAAIRGLLPSTSSGTQ